MEFEYWLFDISTEILTLEMLGNELSNAVKLAPKATPTGCSTGHFAAGRVWASFHSWPNTARRKAPVSFNVKRHKLAAAHIASTNPKQHV